MKTSRWLGRAALAAALALAACSEDSTGPDGADLAFRPSNPGSDFVPAATVAEQQELSTDIWATLSSPSCWDASAIVQAAQPVGTVAQFQFYQGNQYRFYGFSVFLGTVLLHQVGRYQGLPTAIVETWTGEIEALVVVSAQEIAHVYPHLDGSIIVLRYAASGGPCL